MFLRQFGNHFKHCLVFICCFIICANGNVQNLPYCSDIDTPGVAFVSTLDGKFTSLGETGNVVWQLETEPGPLLTSNIHKLELTNNGQLYRIIPSLSGSLYRFDGLTVDQIPISVDSLLKSSFKYSDDLVIAGSIDVRTYGLGFRTGTLLYECNAIKCTNGTYDSAKLDDVLVVERSTQTVRAIELRTGNERWNFSVGQHNIKLPQISCIQTLSNLKNWNISAIMPDGLVKASSLTKDGIELKWQYVFPSPIVKVWKWNGSTLEEVDLFVTPSENSPAIYLGMHKRQLYVHESKLMYNDALVKRPDSNIALANTQIIKIPWKPVPATDSAQTLKEDSTALSVLYASEYANENGYFLFTEEDNNKTVLSCENNSTIEAHVETTYIILSIWVWWKEITLISLSTAIAFHYLIIHYSREEIIPTETSSSSFSKVSISEQTATFSSRYTNDFETLRCLGKGGFGVVFEVKQRIDECCYAIKRITLPNKHEKRERVMREVKALAKLEHPNIVRYFNSWTECPPCGWQDDFNPLLQSGDSETIDSTHRHRCHSTSIIMPNSQNNDSDDDSFIVFESDSKLDNSKLENSTLETSHHEKKVNWKRPSRKSYSLDSSINFPSKQQIGNPTRHFLYIQMQLCQKTSLRDWLDINKQRDSKMINDFFGQIVSAVEYVHLQGLIHRDLKPSNIFFSLEGQIKVGDFGLVKDMQDCLDLELLPFSTVSNQSHTREVGTRLYMSPEQEKRLPYDYKVDIFSLGLIFFELLLPFVTDMERIHALTKLRKNEYPKEFINKYPQEHKLLTQMLCEDPKQRLTTIGLKARPPFKKVDSRFGTQYDFEMPKLSKSVPINMM